MAFNFFLYNISFLKKKFDRSFVYVILNTFFFKFSPSKQF